MNTLGGGALTWRSVNQSCIVDSIMEAQYVAASEVAKEAIWFWKFLIALKLIPLAALPLVLFCNNIGLMT